MVLLPPGIWLLASLLNSWSLGLLAPCLLLLWAFLSSSSQKKPLSVLLGILFLLLSSFVLMEGILRILPPKTLGLALGTAVWNRYAFSGEGIYRWCPELGIRIMRPELKCSMWFLGHAWVHETNSDGWRDDEGASSSSIILLGDSMIYGHGVQRDNTIEQKLEQVSVKTVLNAGMQGAQPLEILAFLKRRLHSISPQAIIVMVHGTDAWDTGGCYDPKDLKAFINAKGKDCLLLPSFLALRHEHSLSWYRSLLLDGSYFRSIRAWRFALNKLMPNPMTPTLELMQSLNHPQVHLGWKANLRALWHIKNYCNKRHCRLLIIDTHLSKPLAADLHCFLAREGIDFKNVWSPLIRAKDRGDCIFLPNDGHTTGKGNRIIAEVIGQWLKEG